MMRRAKPHDFAINGRVAHHPVIAAAETVGFDRAKCFFRRAPQGQARIILLAPNDNATAPRYKVNQATESVAFGFKHRINLRLIVFEGREIQVSESVMKEMRLAV